MNRAKIRRARVGKWGGGCGKNGRESPVSPQPPRVFSISFYIFWLSWLNDFSPLSWEPGTGYHLYKSVPFTEKRPRRPETGIKDGFEEMEHEFLFVIFHQEKQDYLFSCSVAPGNFPLGSGPKNSFSIYFRRDFPESSQKFSSPSISNTPPPPPPFSGKKVIFTKPP